MILSSISECSHCELCMNIQYCTVISSTFQKNNKHKIYVLLKWSSSSDMLQMDTSTHTNHKNDMKNVRHRISDMVTSAMRLISLQHINKTREMWLYSLKKKMIPNISKIISTIWLCGSIWPKSTSLAENTERSQNVDPILGDEKLGFIYDSWYIAE